MGMGQTGSAEHRAKRPIRAGRFLRGVAAGLLVVLAALALPAAPSAACGGGDAGENRHAAALGFDSDHAAAPAFHGQERPHGGHDAPASAACCVAFRCPMLLGDLPRAPARASPPSGSFVRVSVAVRRLDGLDIPPALPPRGVA